MQKFDYEIGSRSLFTYFTPPTLVTFTWVNNACGLSPVPTAARYPTFDLVTKKGRNQAKHLSLSSKTNKSINFTSPHF